MKRVVVDMQNVLFSSAIADALQHFDGDFQVYQSEKPSETAALCVDAAADVLLMEVQTAQRNGLRERMRIRDAVKGRLPACKIVLVVDENDEKELTGKIRQAKKDGLIDQFLYGSVSSAYLAAMIDAL